MIRIFILITFLILPIIGCKLRKEKKVIKENIKMSYKDIELEKWKEELNKAPFFIDIKTLKNPFVFFNFYKKITTEESEVSPLSLVGIITKHNKKFALLQDSAKRGFIVKEHSRIGNVVVVEIGNNYVILEEKKKNIFGQEVIIRHKLVLGKDKI